VVTIAVVYLLAIALMQDGGGCSGPSSHC
jgi:hypothetical protein